jgi:two-component system, chemotaxis family, sensor kinase CheA
MISKKYKDLYLSTTKQQLKKLADLLIYLEKKPNNQNLIENIFRLIHSMKGAGATMGYKKTVNLLHAMESVVDASYDGDLNINTKVLNIFFDTLNVLKDNFDNIDKHDKEIILPKHIKPLKAIFNKDSKKKSKQKRRNKHILGSIPSVAEVAVSTDNLDSLSHSLDDLLINAMRIKARVKEIADVDLLKVCVDNDKILADLRRQLEKIRIIPLKDVLSSLPYLVREIAREEDKQVDIIIKDHGLSLDKAISDELVEILIQLLKNAVSHGISSKQKKGKIIVDFTLLGDRMRVLVSDNGRGIDWSEIAAMAVKNKIVSAKQAKSMDVDQIKKLVFSAGISKGTSLSTSSGRGFGLNLVNTKVQELDGSIEVISTLKKGTKFIIDLPQPLSVFRSITFSLLNYTFALPLDHIDTMVALDEPKNLKGVKTFNHKKKKYKLISLLDTFVLGKINLLYKYIILINYQGQKIALPVLRRVREDELIIKKTPLVLKDNKYIKGVAISAQGQVTLVLDINSLI